jgi:DNA-binding XRE family transcriptional regulator
LTKEGRQCIIGICFVKTIAQGCVVTGKGLLPVTEGFNKNELISKMTENLRLLRNKLGLTQDMLAGKIGISRQTLVNIENKKREMTWNNFLVLLTVFRAESSTSDLLDHFGIYTIELNKYLTSPENANSDK